MHTITWDDFTKILSNVDAVCVDDCLIQSPVDYDGNVTMVVNDDDMNQEHLSFNESENSSIIINSNHITLVDDEGHIHNVEVLKKMHIGALLL